MDNSDNIKRIFAPSGCLEKDTLLDYLAGKTDAQQTRAIEMHLADCPLCSDAAEGLSLMDSPAHIDTLLQEIKPGALRYQQNEFVLPAVHAQPRTKNLQKRIVIGIAASLALLVASYFSISYLGMSDMKKDIISYEDPAKAEESPEMSAPAEEAKTDEVVAHDGILGKSKEGAGESGYYYKDQSEQTVATGKVSPDDSKNLQKGPIESDYSGDLESLFANDGDTEDERVVDKVAELDDTDRNGWVAEEKAVDGVTTISGESVSRSAKKESGKNDNQPAVAGDVMQNAVGGQQEQPQREINNGLEAYKQGDYIDASLQFDQALKSDPDQPQALYYNGMSFYYLHQYNDALKQFQKVLKDKKSQYYEASQWQIAIIYIESGDVRQARKTLNDIIDGNGTYRHPAEEAIKNLGDQ